MQLHDNPLAKLAIVLQCASTGGLRYCLRLAEGLIAQRPDLELTCYVGTQVLTVFGEDSVRGKLAGLGIRCRPWPELPSRPARKRRWYRLMKYHRAQADYAKWLQHFNEYQLVFFAWPYSLECPELNSQIAFIPHDFNYSHFFGALNMAPDAARQQWEQHSRWLQRAHPIVSSNFIADELSRIFPQVSERACTIPLARLSDHDRLPEVAARSLIESLGIQGEYILSLNNVSYHKNLGQVLGAFHYVRQTHPHLSLVIAGHNTTGIRGNMNTPWYVDPSEHDANVLGLGMRTDQEVTALIQCARLVINASLYEAGNGSGLDAWALGTPVAMSDIPPFQEHMTTLGVQAELFHPRCCFQIRDAILATLNDSPAVASRVAESREAMARYDWEKVAQHYLAAFDRMLAKPKAP